MGALLGHPQPQGLGPAPKAVAAQDRECRGLAGSADPMGGRSEDPPEDLRVLGDFPLTSQSSSPIWQMAGLIGSVSISGSVILDPLRQMSSHQAWGGRGMGRRAGRPPESHMSLPFCSQIL